MADPFKDDSSAFVAVSKRTMKTTVMIKEIVATSPLIVLNRPKEKAIDDCGGRDQTSLVSIEHSLPLLASWQK